MYAAASVAAIIILLFILNPSSTLHTFDSLESDTIAAYLETDNSFLSAYDLGELLTDEELEAISDVLGEDVDLVGFYSYGELAPFSDELMNCHLHNQTLTLTVIYEE